MNVKFVELVVVPPRRGLPDNVEMIALDDEGRLWYRLSMSDAGGWTDWKWDHSNPEDPEA